MITTIEFRALLNLFMCSDPWPTPYTYDHEKVEEFLNKTANNFGFVDWLQAYHEL